MAQPSSPAAGIPGPPARIGTGVSPPRRDDPAAALNQVLSEVIDAILDVRQALRRVPETQALHNELDQLLADLRTWAQLLADQDSAALAGRYGDQTQAALTEIQWGILAHKHALSNT